MIKNPTSLFFLKLGIFVCLLLTPSSINSQILINSRRIEWKPGITNGIPEIEGPINDVLDYGADPSGVFDSYIAFNQAMNDLPETGGIIYIPKGDFLINSTITINKDNIIFRGEGITKSKLLMNFSGNSFDIVTYERGEWQSIESINKEQDEIIVPDASKFEIGQFVEIQQNNDSTIMYTKPEWNVDWAKHSVGQLFQIDNIESNKLILKSKTHIDFNTIQNPTIRPQGFIENVGFEKFKIEKIVDKGITFAFKNVAYCWVRDIDSYKASKAHIDINTGLGCEIRDSYFHGAHSYGGGGHGYGVRCGYHSTDILIENNIFDSLRHSMLVSLGANGNVFGYNYSINNLQGEELSNLNQDWIPPDISIHGHYAYMNLFEGNDVMEIGIGDHWGPSGIGNTYFRNRVNGEGIIYHDYSNKQNIIGNITTTIKDVDENSQHKLEHGNNVGGNIVWDPTISDHSLVNSYYLENKPYFFNTLAWPPFDPSIVKDNKLPAQIRFEEVLDFTNNYATETNFEVEFYPNPCKTTINIDLKEVQSNIDITILNLEGKQILNKKISFFGNTHIIESINVSHLDSGIYIISLQDGFTMINKKLILN